ncbi:TetR/AcrR family transcriptional regulator [Antrihabitans spumae]|uniref:TetR/AcrR family transcriptional regulator n=1 Tax=Antrihabitans spumae TaxID=3373370 RepID=A0ABW7K3K0_9NOCA
MAKDSTSARGRLPELKGDARTDRWREHRAGVKADLIESTLRAIDEFGPDLSIDDIIGTAGIPRPKLYRFFRDKEELFEGVSERVQELVLERLTPHLVVAGAALEAVRSGLRAYVDLVVERPNVFRFVVNSQFSGSHSATDLLERGMAPADATVAMLGSIIRMRGGNGDNMEYLVDAILGAVALSVLRWLNTPTIEKDALVDELTVIVWGALSASAASRGVVLDPDEELSVVPNLFD